jgi:hypothetical protein
MFMFPMMMFTPDLVEARPDIRQMTCKSATDLVRKNGSVVMTLTRNTYDKVVANRSACHSAKKLVVQSKDTKSCFVGYRCTPNMGGR